MKPEHQLEASAWLEARHKDLEELEKAGLSRQIAEWMYSALRDGMEYTASLYEGRKTVGQVIEEILHEKKPGPQLRVIKGGAVDLKA